MLRNTSEAFKRAVAVVMHTDIYTKNDVIYEQGKHKEMMVYIAAGSVRILSAEDSESAILTFGMGTLLGESSLIFNSYSPVKASIQMLDTKCAKIAV